MTSRKYGWQVNPNDVNRTRIVSGTGAFGDMITAELLPQAQVDFVYGSHPETQVEKTVVGGTVTFADSMASCSSTSTIGSKSQINTASTARYRPGQGMDFRLTAKFGEPAVGVRQLAGGDAQREDGLFFGYNDEDAEFGVCRRHSAAREIHTLTVTVGSGGVETGTVTLNGVAINVALTAGSIAETAQEIAEGTYAGWEAHAVSGDVHFIADYSEVLAGAYSFSSTGVADGTMAQAAAGTAAVYDWTKQAEWNHDKFDGDGPSGETLNPQMGNLYYISLQYLGFGAIDFFVEDPETGRPQLAHRIDYANKNTIPSLGNPTLSCCIGTMNVSGSTATTISSGSMAVFTEGISRPLGPAHGEDVVTTITAATPVLSVRNDVAFVDGVSRLSTRDLLPFITAFAGAANKPMQFSIVRNGVLTDPLWTKYSDHSIASTDTSATGIAGGDTILTSSIGINGNEVISLLEHDLHLHPGNIFTLVMAPTGVTADVIASLSWKEDV